MATFQLFTPAELTVVDKDPPCGTGNTMILMAQAVPSATAVPCVASVPAGWDIGNVAIREGRGWFWLNSEVAGKHAVEVMLRPRDECDLAGTTEVPSDEPGTRRFERPEQLPPALRSTRFYTYPGACVTYEFAFEGDVSASLMFEIDSALSFQPRAELVEKVDQHTGLSLCGVFAPRCAGE
jgi:hypothetical protein